MLIPVVIAVAVFIGLGKKKPNDNVRDGELPQETLRHSPQLDQENK